jgi:Tfp pilus assembly PilM family ATPase
VIVFVSQMKIISQSSDELVLKEGSTSGIIVGAVLIVAGALAGYFLRQSNPIVPWIALGLVVVGIVVILFSSSITVVANKASGQVLYQKKRLVGGNSSTYAIGEIFRIETRKQWRVENTPPSGNQGASMPQPVLVAQSVIVFKDGRELALDHQKTSSTTSVGSVVLMGGQGAETAIAAQVAKFLDVPFQEIAPPNMGTGLNIQL